MDEKELQAVSEALEQLRQGGTISAETLQKLGGTTQSANKAMNTFSQSVLKNSTALGSMARQIGDGEGSFKSMNGAIQGVTGVLGSLASALPLVGGAAKALADGVGKAASFVLDQLDVMAKNYQNIGDASAGAQDGLTGLMRQFNQMGNYSLPAFTKAVKSNVTGLAALGGTAADGAEELSKVTGALTTGDAAKRFLNLGISLDKVGDTTAQYLSDFSRLGTTQGLTTDQLIKKSQNYIIELDKLARITGQSREAAQQEQQRSMINVAYRAKMIQLEEQGRKDEAEQLALYVNNLSGPMAEAARAQIAGIPATKDAAKANLFMNDSIRQNIIAIQDGKKASTALNDTMYEAKDATRRFSNQALYGQESFGGVYAAAADMASIIDKSGKTRLEREADIDQAMKNQSEATDNMSEDFTTAQLATANASKNIQRMGFYIANKAVPAVETFSEALEGMTDFINDHFGGIAKSKQKQQNQENWNNMKWGSKISHGLAVGLEDLTDAVGLHSLAENARNARIRQETEEFGNKPRSDVDKILSTIRTRESGGDYTIKAKGSSASGAYQFIDKTWQGLTQKYGIGTEFKSARLAPREVQDSIAKKYVEEILKQSGGDVSKVPLAWYTGNIQGKISPEALAANNGLTPEMYQNRWMKDYGRMPSGNNGLTLEMSQNRRTNDNGRMPSGPSSGYQSSIVGIDPASAGTETSAREQQKSGEQESSRQNDVLTGQLAQLNQTQKQLLDVNKKILARQS